MKELGVCSFVDASGQNCFGIPLRRIILSVNTESRAGAQNSRASCHARVSRSWNRSCGELLDVPQCSENRVATAQLSSRKKSLEPWQAHCIKVHRDKMLHLEDTGTFEVPHLYEAFRLTQWRRDHGVPERCSQFRQLLMLVCPAYCTCYVLFSGGAAPVFCDSYCGEQRLANVVCMALP